MPRHARNCARKHHIVNGLTGARRKLAISTNQRVKKAMRSLEVLRGQHSAQASRTDKINLSQTTTKPNFHQMITHSITRNCQMTREVARKILILNNTNQNCPKSSEIALYCPILEKIQKYCQAQQSQSPSCAELQSYSQLFSATHRPGKSFLA